MHRLQQCLVVNQAHQKHQHYTGSDPVKLFKVCPGKLGVESGAVDLHDSQQGDQQDQGEQHPVEVAIAHVPPHRCALKLPFTAEVAECAEAIGSISNLLLGVLCDLGGRFFSDFAITNLPACKAPAESEPGSLAFHIAAISTGWFTCATSTCRFRCLST